MALNKFDNKNFLIYENLYTLQNSDESFFFFRWVWNQLGICGNEIADQLAKLAVTDIRQTLFIRDLYGSIKRLIVPYILSKICLNFTENVG